MKACETHKLAVSPSLKEAASWITTFHKLHGFYPLPCRVCGYLILEVEPKREAELRMLQGAIKSRPELEKYLVQKQK